MQGLSLLCLGHLQLGLQLPVPTPTPTCRSTELRALTPMPMLTCRSMPSGLRARRLPSLYLAMLTSACNVPSIFPRPSPMAYPSMSPLARGKFGPAGE